MIVEKLPNLESLELQLAFDGNLRGFLDLSHLTTMTIKCVGYSINSILQTLSLNGVIEVLELIAGVFDAEKKYATPLIFKKLKSLTWKDPLRISNFFLTMAKAHMPVITNFRFISFLTKQSNAIPEFIQSK